MKPITTPRVLLILLLFLTPLLSRAQGKEANNWYFGNNAGITFNQGSPPVALLDGQTVNVSSRVGYASMSDEDGNLLFYSDGVTIWNKDHDTMVNGDMMGTWTTQGALIIQDPGNENRYYFFNFNFDYPNPCYFQYSIIDMTNGIGEVIPNKKSILLCTNTTQHLTAVLDDNMTDVWVLTHGFGTNKFIAFKVTPDSIITNPVNSYAGSIYNVDQGYMKISSNGAWLGVGNDLQLLTEIYHFDNSTGIVSNQNVVTIPVPAYGIEFSPDNTKMYAHGSSIYLFQYDISLNDPAQIAASGVLLSNLYFDRDALQLGPDGKIYVGTSGGYLSVIHEPDKKGLLCNFEYNAIYLEGRSYSDGLPTFLQSYMRSPEFTSLQKCSGQSTQFNIVNTNGIDSVFWQFHDPGNAPNDTSTLFSPSYTFSTADTFYVELTAYSGLLQRKVTDTVIIYQTPDPNLGNDTTFCANETINFTLDAGPGEYYLWNNDFNPADSTYQVTAPGMYRVKVTDHGCVGRDTIYVSRYPEPVIDTSNVNYSNANCGLPDGRIEGVQVTGTFTGLEWQNSSGTIVGTGIDLTDVPAGLYTLHVFYGDNCSVEPVILEIENNSGPQIMNVLDQPDHCNRGMGKLTVVVTPGSGDPLSYSLDGNPFTSSNLFEGLYAGDHTVTVMDVNNCTDNYSITLDNIPGPTITGSGTSPENGYQSNGTITVTATGDSVYYALNGGTPQGTGTFTGLSAGDYEITIADKWGCEVTITLTVEREPGIVLSAWAGNDYKCREELAYSTITAGNFINVKEFKAVLNYNQTLLNCTSYKTTSEFPVISVTNNPGTVEVLWQSDIPKTLPGNVPLIDLIFTTQNWGVSDIKWDSVYSEFTDGFGNRIVDSLNPGVITINDPPLLANTSLKTEYCEGEAAVIAFNYTGGTDPVNIAWRTPDNANVPGLSHSIDSISLAQAGNYYILANDANNCKASLTIPVTVYAKPTSGFEAYDTIWFEHSIDLIATQGYASYQWNTGDTSYYITVDKEGKYSVLMETAEGCTALSEVTMATTIVPINIPNAFTPNGDGLNDTFRPLVDKELIRRYHLVIYNKWGQLLFETSDPANGWDGENAVPGVYVWVINYENRVGKAEQIKGNMAVIK